MKDLYKLASEFLKLSQLQSLLPPKEPLSTSDPSKLGPVGSMPGKPRPQRIDKQIQYSLNQLGYPGSLTDSGLLDQNTLAAIGWFRTKFNYKPGGNLLQQIKNELFKRESGPSAHEMAQKNIL